VLLLLDVFAVKEKRNRRKKAEQNLAFFPFYCFKATHNIPFHRKERKGKKSVIKRRKNVNKSNSKN
jgi:hypothetical protein